MKKISLFIFAIFLVPFFLSSQEMTVEQARGLYSLLENIDEQKSLFPEEVKAASLLSLMDDTYKTDSTVPEDNRIVFANNANLYIEKNRSLLCFSAYIVPEKEMSEELCIQFANAWNKEKIFLIVCWDTDEKAFRLEYYLSYAGGIHADNLNASLSWFFELTYSFINYLNSNF